MNRLSEQSLIGNSILHGNWGVYCFLCLLGYFTSKFMHQLDLSAKTNPVQINRLLWIARGQNEIQGNKMKIKIQKKI